MLLLFVFYINFCTARVLFGNFMPKQALTKQAEDKYKSQVLTYVIEFAGKSDNLWKNHYKLPATKKMISKPFKNVSLKPDFKYKVDLPGTQQNYFEHAQEHLDHEVNGYFEVDTNESDLKTTYNVANEHSGFISDTEYSIKNKKVF